MIKKITTIFAFALLGFSQLFAQNVGVGIAAPTAKLHVVQTANTQGIILQHSGDADGIADIHTGATGAGQFILMGNTANGFSALEATHLGIGFGYRINMLNAGSPSAAMFIDQDGTANTAHGVSVDMDADNQAVGVLVNHAGLGPSFFTSLTNAANTASAFDARVATAGRGLYMDLTNANNGSSGAVLFHAGLGRGYFAALTNANNPSIGLGVYHDGLGLGVDVDLSNAASTATAVDISHDGVGRGMQIALNETTNADMGLGIFHAGVDGLGAYIGMTDANATQNSIGLIVNYQGTQTAAGGGGNAVEVQHQGSNGNAIDVFMGTTTVAPGPANTTSEYSCISATHFGTGTGTAGYKSAYQGSTNGGDPVVIAFQGGSEEGEGVLSFANPNGANDPISIYGYSYEAANPGFGVGVQGIGGWYGVHGIQNGTNFAYTYGVASTGDMTTLGGGTKPFTIDYPLDPENKILRHYALESNEVLNVYRGIIELDANGQAIVELPEYFDAVNISPSYQLTAIGTPNQPYVATEISNNQFTVAGTPNTKVSWAVYAKRNDPGYRYYDQNGKNYDQEVSEKPARMKGKYYLPEAYGQPASKGIHYDDDIDSKLNRAKEYQQKSIEKLPTAAKAKSEKKEEREKTNYKVTKGESSKYDVTQK